MWVEPADLTAAERPSALAAQGQLTLREVGDGPAFDAVYDLLATFFAERGELEPREVLAGFAASGTAPSRPELRTTYHLVGAWEGDELVGARDCYVDVDLRDRRVLVSLAHSLVVPRWRRRGLAALFRALPAGLGRRAAVAAFGEVVPTMIVAEMEPADPDDPDTLVRLLAYGRSGFGAMDPARVPYSQPVLSPGGAGALPLLGVVRTLGLPPGSLPAPLAAWFPELFHLTHAAYLPDARVAPSRDHALATVARSADPVAVWPLPTASSGPEAWRPLVRSAVLAHYPPALRGPGPPLGDVEAEARAAAAWWRPAWSTAQPIVR
jgi:hypothetical protein